MSDHNAEEPLVDAPDSEDWIDTTDVRSHEPSAMGVFFVWEKLRLVFNGIWAWWLYDRISSMPGARRLDWELFLSWLIAGNIWFCVGPIVENYLGLCRVPRKLVRWLVFPAILVTGMIFVMGNEGVLRWRWWL